MVSLQNYYDKVTVSIITSPLLTNKINELFGQVIMKLPDEEQFGMKGQINFCSRSQAIEYWNNMVSLIKSRPDMSASNKEGVCIPLLQENIESSIFFITIIVDNLDTKSDDYIKGLIVHEISEMSYAWRILQKELSQLKRPKPKVRQIRFNQLTKQDAPIGSPEHKEHERNVNDEVKRLRFSEEIFALDRQ